MGHARTLKNFDTQLTNKRWTLAHGRETAFQRLRQRYKNNIQGELSIESASAARAACRCRQGLRASRLSHGSPRHWPAKLSRPRGAWGGRRLTLRPTSLPPNLGLAPSLGQPILSWQHTPLTGTPLTRPQTCAPRTCGSSWTCPTASHTCWPWVQQHKVLKSRGRGMESLNVLKSGSGNEMCSPQKT